MECKGTKYLERKNLQFIIEVVKAFTFHVTSVCSFLREPPIPSKAKQHTMRQNYKARKRKGRMLSE